MRYDGFIFRYSFLGPLSAVFLAHRTGGLTWSHVLLWAAAIQSLLLCFETLPRGLRVDEDLLTGKPVSFRPLLMRMVIPGTLTLGVVSALVIALIARWMLGQ